MDIDEADEILKPYYAELDETYLFPERERAGQLEEIAEKFEVDIEKVKDDFEESRPMGEWLMTFWARLLDPTSPNFHELTPIIARVRYGCSTDREFDWLGLRLTLAIMLDEHELLKKATKLATKPIEEKAAFALSLASFDYFDDTGELPSYTRLCDYVENATGEKQSRYESITSDNWNRHWRQSGLANLKRVKSK